MCTRLLIYPPILVTISKISAAFKYFLAKYNLHYMDSVTNLITPLNVLKLTNPDINKQYACITIRTPYSSAVIILNVKISEIIENIDPIFCPKSTNI